MADTDKIYNSIAAEKARAQYVKNLMGAADGIATLDSSGLVPSDQLPSYIDDIVELVNITDTAPSTCSKGDWYFNTTTSKLYKATAANTWGMTAYNPEKAKIYFNKTDEKSYRWGGSAMVEVSTSDIIGIKVGSSGSTITPSQGVIELPAYEAGAQVNPSVMGASGSTHASGLVPDTPTTAGTTKFLREDGTWQTPEGGAMYVPTLNSAPTSSTTTYTKDGQTVDFEIGQFARVADAEAEEGYVFFQLYDLTTEGNVTTAKWKEANTGGGGYSTTVLTVSVTSDTGEADLSDVTITVTDTTASSTVTPQQDGTYKIPTGHGYSVSVSDDVEGYKAPDAATGTAAGTTATVTMTYEEQAGFVDLGLPSGKKWAIGNLVKDSQGNYSIGAETDWGTYVSWGNIIGHNEGEGYKFDQTTYDSTPGKQVAANIPSNDAAHDIALATLGSPWHLPTKEDFQELYDNTDSEWVADYNGTGVAGRKFMKKTDHSVYVFFPASGYYNGTSLNYRGTNGNCWSSSFISSTGAYRLYFNSSSVSPQLSNDCRYGLSVRPVQ